MVEKPKPLYILGLSFYYHDAAAALIRDGIVIAAAQEERFTRTKHDESVPKNAVAFCLQYAGLSMADIDYVVFYEKPIIKFERLLQTYIRTWPKGLRSFVKAMQSFLKNKLWVEQKIRKEFGFQGKILFTEHHYAHAASAYYSSDFADATIVTMDGVGEWDTTTIGYGNGNCVKLEKTIHFPHSLGLLYSALTYYLGFKVNSAEYKVMGLAPYGNPAPYREHFRKLLKAREDGSFELDTRYFAYEYGLTMTNGLFHQLFDGVPRTPESPLTQREKDIAAALQAATEETVLNIVSHAKKLFPSKNLCLAGGVALNCVANGKILKMGLFERTYIQPAAGDAGGAVGAALYAYYDGLNNARKTGVMSTAFLGPEYTNDHIRTFLRQGWDGKTIRYREVDDAQLVPEAASLISQNHVIGWFQGRMEFGPRALGARSIIADPRNKDNWQKVNLKIKFRESFRPFAPAVLEEYARDYFDLPCESPYMLLVAPVKTNAIPAVTHVDGSARIQTIRRQHHPRFYDLIEAFYKRTGCAVIINTSFNVRSEPIVESPKDAFNCFINTYMDYLVMGNFIIAKRDNMHLVDAERLRQYLGSFSLD